MSKNDNLLKPARPGDFLSARRDRKIIERVNGRITGENVAETSSGFHLRKEIDEDRILVINIDVLDAPAHGLVELAGYDPDKNRYEVRQPTDTDNPNTFIVSGTDIAGGSEGYVFDDRGTHKLLVTGTVVAGDLVGSAILSWNSVPSGSGNYLVRAVSGTDVYVVPAGVGGGAENPDSLGTTAETEAAQTDTWDQEDQGDFEGVIVTKLYRMAYDHLGDQKLYAYYRDELKDVNGRTMTISAETRVTIDTPEECP